MLEQHLLKGGNLRHHRVLASGRACHFGWQIHEGAWSVPNTNPDDSHDGGQPRCTSEPQQCLRRVLLAAHILPFFLVRARFLECVPVGKIVLPPLRRTACLSAGRGNIRHMGRRTMSAIVVALLSWYTCNTMAQKSRPKTKRGASSLSRVRLQRRTGLRRLYGMWKNRKPDPIKQLEKMRKEWERV